MHTRNCRDSNFSPPRSILQNVKFLAAVAVVVIPLTVSATLQVFFDDFGGPTLNPVWQASMPSASLAGWGGAYIETYSGAPNYAFQTLGASSVLRLNNTISAQHRVGWTSGTSFSLQSFRYEVRFNTLNQSSATSIDAFFEIGLFDAANPSRYDIISPYGGDASATLIFTSGSSIDNSFQNQSFNYQNNTWYRLVLDAEPGQNIRVSLDDDSGNELVGRSLGHGADAFSSGFRISLSQAMGVPSQPWPADVAVDYALLTTVPEPGACSLIALGLVGFFVRRKQTQKEVSFSSRPRQ